MNFKNKVWFVIVEIICIILVIFPVYIKSSDVSLIPISVLWFVVGILLIFVFFRNHFDSILVLFGVFYLLQLAFNVLVNYLYVQDPFSTFFYTSDSFSYYEVFFDRGLARPGFLDDFESYLETVISVGVGYSVIAWANNFISSVFDGSNYVMVHHVFIVFISSWIPILFFKILIFIKLSVREAFKATFVFYLFSFYFFYSTSLVRDNFVSLGFALFYYQIFKPSNKYLNFKLLLLSFLTFLIRPTHGMVLLFIFIIHFFKVANKDGTKLLKFIFFSVFLGLFINAIQLDLLVERSLGYIEYHSDLASAAGGISSFYNLPVIGTMIKLIQPHFNPFTLFSPYIVSNHYDNSGELQLCSIYIGFAYFFWFIILLSLSKFHRVKSSSDAYCNTRVVYDKLKLILRTSILIILVLSLFSNETRRLMPLYFPIYIYFFVSKRNSQKFPVNTVIVGSFIFLFLGLLHFFILT